MYAAKIISGCWDEETITLGMPKDFVLSARSLMVLEVEEFKQLQSQIERLKSEFSALSADNNAKRCVLDDEFEIDRKLNAKILSKDARIKELELKLQDFIDSQ